MSYSIPNYNAVKQYISSEGWKGVKEDSEKGVFTVSFSSETKIKTIRLSIRVRDSAIIGYGTIDISAGNDVLAEVAEYVTRANYGLNIGNFELDFSDGELRYKAYLICTDTVASSKDLDLMVTVILRMFERYGNGLVKVIFGIDTPAHAIEEAEAD